VAADQCDVVDQISLAEFRKWAEVWIKALDGDDENSVTSQIYDMMWADAAWRSLNEARRVSLDRNDVGTPGMVAHLLDRGYITGQVISIGRLLDPAASQPRRQVNSIRRLVDEITANRHLLTREIYVCRDGLPYDYKNFRARERSTMSDHGATWLSSQGWLDCHQAMLLHEHFDLLSGVEPDARKRSDITSDAFFSRMASAFDDPVFKDITELRHKSIAHAADDFSRSTSPNLRSGISLNEFGRAHYLLLGLFQTISATLLDQSWRGNALPTPQYDQFEGFDKPLVSSDKIAALHDFWDTHGGERDGWMSEAYHEFVPKKDAS
jgi:hypothetical protein